METGPMVAAFLVGLVAGGFLAWAILAGRQKAAKGAITEALAGLRDAFGNLSYEAMGRALEQLERNTRQFIEGERRTAEQSHAGRDEVLGARLKHLNELLQETTRRMGELEKGREQRFGEVSQEVRSLKETALVLAGETRRLGRFIGGTQARGQWGERMADDILARLGLVEGVNFERQKSTDGGKGRPDYTFLMPNALRLHMDVKLPGSNYERFLDAEDDDGRARYRDAFLKDVRERVREVAARGYGEADHGSLDFVLLFIPSEGMFRFVLGELPDLFEEAAARGVVLASPSVLVALLSVVRQGTELFALRARTDEVLQLLTTFRRQWEKYVERFDALGRRLADAQKEYDNLLGTRRNQLERSLRPLDGLAGAAEEAGDGGEEGEGL